MKNLLVRSLYRIKSPQWFKDRSDEGDIYEHYTKMHDISLQTFQKHLGGDWEFVFFNKEVDNIQQVFRDHFFEIYDLWKSGCNILYCGPDNYMQKPTEFFGKYEGEFRMFNYTDPKQFQHFDHFLNADVRYYSADMPETAWTNALTAAKAWNFDEWNTEQIILNDMLWNQGLKPEHVIQPHLAYQGHALDPKRWRESVEYSNRWNGVDIESAHILHLHGSRNAPQKLNIMESLWNTSQ
jgi:hypothetical protein